MYWHTGYLDVIRSRIHLGSRGRSHDYGGRAQVRADVDRLALPVLWQRMPDAIARPESAVSSTIIGEIRRDPPRTVGWRRHKGEKMKRYRNTLSDRLLGWNRAGENLFFDAMLAIIAVATLAPLAVALWSWL